MGWERYVSRVARQLTPPTITSSRPPAISTRIDITRPAECWNRGTSSDATLCNADTTRHDTIPHHTASADRPSGHPRPEFSSRGIPRRYPTIYSNSIHFCRHYFYLRSSDIFEKLNAEKCNVFAFYIHIFAYYIWILCKCIRVYMGSQIISGKFNFANADGREFGFYNINITTFK